MHLAFVDFVYGYDASRPEADAPLGGTTSAVCFLAHELVKAGVACSFFNRVAVPGTAHGIPAMPLHALSNILGQKNECTAYIFCGRWTEEWVYQVRANTRAPIIAWMHESTFAHPFTPALDAFDAVIYVSEWQQRINQNKSLDSWRQTVIRNAMNPAVAASFPTNTPVLVAKTMPPVLLFAGSFARGVFHIAPLLDKIRPHYPSFTTEIYCNLDPSRHAEQDAAYISHLRAQPNIAHIGMVGQTKLAQAMRNASVFLAPNPWPETSNIALIEALASGLQAVMTNRAALPETASGFARQVPISAPDDPLRFDTPIDYDLFAGQVLEALHQRESDPQATEAQLRRQIDFFHAHYQWAQRVDPWIEFIKTLTV